MRTRRGQSARQPGGGWSLRHDRLGRTHRSPAGDAVERAFTWALSSDRERDHLSEQAGSRAWTLREGQSKETRQISLDLALSSYGPLKDGPAIQLAADDVTVHETIRLTM